jgi:hypothetical protein
MHKARQRPPRLPRACAVSMRRGPVPRFGPDRPPPPWASTPRSTALCGILILAPGQAALWPTSRLPLAAPSLSGPPTARLHRTAANPSSTCCTGWRPGSTGSQGLKGALSRSLTLRSFALPSSLRWTRSRSHSGASTFHRCVAFASAATLAVGPCCRSAHSASTQRSRITRQAMPVHQNGVVAGRAMRPYPHWRGRRVPV